MVMIGLILDYPAVQDGPLVMSALPQSKIADIIFRGVVSIYPKMRFTHVRMPLCLAKMLEIFRAISRMMQPDPSGEENGVCRQKPNF